MSEAVPENLGGGVPPARAAASSAAAPRRAASVWDVARGRLRALARDGAARLEVGAVALLLGALFGPAALSWWGRWTQDASPQAFAVWVVPLALAWCWVNRLRLALPEHDALAAQFNEESMVRILTEEEPERPKRLVGPLAGGALLTLAGLWTGDPTLTCLAFLLVLVGAVAFRHGTQALRAAFFPLAFLAAMIPVPGVFLDIFERKLQLLLLGVTTNVWKIVGMAAEQEVEGNPVYFPNADHPAFSLFAGKVGSGFSEAILALLLGAWYLSLVRAPFRRKLLTLVLGFLWLSLLVLLRLAFVGWLGGSGERDLMDVVPAASRLLLLAAGVGGVVGIGRALGCREYQPWVSA